MIKPSSQTRCEAQLILLSVSQQLVRLTEITKEECVFAFLFSFYKEKDGLFFPFPKESQSETLLIKLEINGTLAWARSVHSKQANTEEQRYDC